MGIAVGFLILLLSSLAEWSLKKADHQINNTSQEGKNASSLQSSTGHSKYQFLHSEGTSKDKEFRCPRDFGRFPDIRDCSKYYECQKSKAWPLVCPPDTLFSPETFRCDKASKVACPPYESLKKVICYFSNEQENWLTSAKFNPEHLNPYLCTHVHYSHAVLDPNSLKLAIGNHQMDIIDKSYSRVTSLRKLNPELKVILTIRDSKGYNIDQYSRMAADPEKRQAFIKHLVSFLLQNRFDGVEIDWEYPVCKTPLCHRNERGNLKDKENFASFIQELRNAFDDGTPPLLLSAKVSGSKNVIDAAYDVPTISRYCNYLILMAYMTEGFSGIARHPGRMYPNPEIRNDVENVDFAVNYWMRRGAPSKKLILGIRVTGKAYILDDDRRNNVDSPISDIEYSEDVNFKEVCQRIKFQDWRAERDKYAVPSAYNHREWLAYEDPKSVFEKTEYAMKMGLGGVMFCAAIHDDFVGECCKVKYPLLKGALYALNKKGMAPEMFKCPTFL